MATDRDDDRLEALLAAARDARPPGDALVARVLADATAVQAEAGASTSVARRGPLAGLLATLGGWPGLSGVTAAGVAGLALGFWAPELVDGWTGGQLWLLSGGAGTVPEIGALWAEAGDV